MLISGWVFWSLAQITKGKSKKNPEQEVSEAFLGLSRRPLSLPDKTSLAVYDLQILYIDLQIHTQQSHDMTLKST